MIRARIHLETAAAEKHRTDARFLAANFESFERVTLPLIEGDLRRIEPGEFVLAYAADPRHSPIAELPAEQRARVVLHWDQTRWREIDPVERLTRLRVAAVADLSVPYRTPLAFGWAVPIDRAKASVFLASRPPGLLEATFTGMDTARFLVAYLEAYERTILAARGLPAPERANPAAPSRRGPASAPTPPAPTPRGTPRAACRS